MAGPCCLAGEDLCVYRRLTAAYITKLWLKTCGKAKQLDGFRTLACTRGVWVYLVALFIGTSQNC